jgi:hypothetical protein
MIVSLESKCMATKDHVLNANCPEKFQAKTQLSARPIQDQSAIKNVRK